MWGPISWSQKFHGLWGKKKLFSQLATQFPAPLSSAVHLKMLGYTAIFVTNMHYRSALLNHYGQVGYWPIGLFWSVLVTPNNENFHIIICWRLFPPRPLNNKQLKTNKYHHLVYNNPKHICWHTLGDHPFLFNQTEWNHWFDLFPSPSSLPFISLGSTQMRYSWEFIFAQAGVFKGAAKCVLRYSPSSGFFILLSRSGVFYLVPFAPHLLSLHVCCYCLNRKCPPKASCVKRWWYLRSL